MTSAVRSKGAGGAQSSPAGSKRLVIDANVWLDYFDARRAHSSEAKECLEVALQKGCVLLYPVGSIKDVYYILCATAKREFRAMYGELTEVAARAAEGFAWGCVQSMRSVATAVGADESDLWLAEKNHEVQPDLEDDLVIAAAQRSGADLLVTSDRGLLQHAPVACVTPQDAVKLLAHA